MKTQIARFCMSAAAVFFAAVADLNAGVVSFPAKDAHAPGLCFDGQRKNRKVVVKVRALGF